MSTLGDAIKARMFAEPHQIPPEPPRTDIEAWVDWRCKYGGWGVAEIFRELAARIAALEDAPANNSTGGK